MGKLKRVKACRCGCHALVRAVYGKGTDLRRNGEFVHYEMDWSVEWARDAYRRMREMIDGVRTVD